MIKHKFRAKQTINDGIKFSSKKEAARYQVLKNLQSNGEVLFFTRQAPFHLPGNIRYVVDFTVYWADGHVTFEDVKGFATPMYKLKKTQVESIYPVEITEI